MNRITLLLAFIIAILTTSCDRGGASQQNFNAIGALIESHPDAAWEMLQAVDPHALSSDGDRAKHALLSVLALDRLAVQDSAFNRLQPAIDYYIDQGQGSPNERLQAYYCRGIINYQRNEPELAMRNMVDALSIKGATDTAVMCRAWIYSGLVYSIGFRFDEEADSYKEAARLYKVMGDIDKYRDCMMRIAQVYVNTNNEQARAYRDSIAACHGSDPAASPVDLAELDLKIACTFGNGQEIERAIDNYAHQDEMTQEGLLRLAVAYYRIGKDREAEECLARTSEEFRRNNSAAYYQALIEAYNYSGDRDKLLDAMLAFLGSIQNNIHYNATHGTNFAAEMREMELMSENRVLERDRVILVTIGCILILVIVVITTYFRLRMKSLENERIKAYVISLEDERDNLNQLLADKSHEDVDQTIKEIVRNRLAMLNKFFAAQISDKGNFDFEANKELRNLVSDRDQFMDSTRLAFTASSPAFVRYLQEHGLTQWEINYCCLYLLGLRGKEIGNYLGIRSQYNVSSAIRSKLGLDEGNANLGIYLRKLHGTLSD